MIRRSLVKPELKLINLIDVMMILLIIFMLAAPTIHQWVDVDLPSAEVSRAKITEGIIISVTKEGAVYIDREKTDLKEFASTLAEIWKTRSHEPVFIRADGEIQYKYVMKIISETKKLGGENVGLVVEDGKRDNAK